MAPIKGFPERKRMRRIGIVRLGVKLISERTGREYPRPTEYFVVDDAPGLAEIYGDKPKVLNILLVSDEPEITFPYYMMRYRQRGLVCMGDGDHILRRRGDNGKWEVSRGVNLQTGEIEPCHSLECPFAIRPENGSAECQPTGRLRFLCADNPTHGYYQLTVRKRAIEGFLGQMEFARTVLGRLTGYPWQLIMEQETVQLESGQRKLWIPQLEIEPAIFQELLKLRHAGKPLVLPEGISKATPEMEQELTEDLDYEASEEPFPEEQEAVEESDLAEELDKAMAESEVKEVKLKGLTAHAYYDAVERIRRNLKDQGAMNPEIEKFLAENLQGIITPRKVEAAGTKSREWEPAKQPQLIDERAGYIEP